MNFGLVDRIVELESGHRIVAVKAVSLAEEYLSDHFPAFPVLPGVLMLQALVESATWLVREAQDFAQSVILLGRVQQVTYKSFVRPGQLLRLEVTCRRLAHGDSDFEGSGYCEQAQMVRARFGLVHFCAGRQDSADGGVDERLRATARKRLALLWNPPANASQARSAAGEHERTGAARST